MIALTVVAHGLLALLQPAGLQCPDKGMSSAHFVYITGCVVLGVVLGYVLGARAVRAEIAAARKKAESRAARKPET